MSSLYDKVDRIREEYESCAPQSYKKWSKSCLDSFDAKQIGTKIQLEERRAEYEVELVKLHKEYRSDMWKAQQKLMTEFACALKEEFFDKDIPNEIAARVYARAWDEGHSQGLYEVIHCYEDLAQFVIECLDLYKS